MNEKKFAVKSLEVSNVSVLEEIVSNSPQHLVEGLTDLGVSLFFHLGGLCAISECGISLQCWPWLSAEELQMDPFHLTTRVSRECHLPRTELKGRRM